MLKRGMKRDMIAKEEVLCKLEMLNLMATVTFAWVMTTLTRKLVNQRNLCHVLIVADLVSSDVLQYCNSIVKYYGRSSIMPAVLSCSNGNSSNISMAMY